MLLSGAPLRHHCSRAIICLLTVCVCVCVCVCTYEAGFKRPGSRRRRRHWRERERQPRNGRGRKGKKRGRGRQPPHRSHNCRRVKEDLPAVPPLRYLSVAEVKRRVRRIWGGRTHASLRAGCGYRSGSATPRHPSRSNFQAVGFPSYKTRVTAPLDVRAGWKSEGASHTGRPQSDHHHR